MSEPVLPASLAALPTDRFGRPVPWVTGELDGEPQLGANDTAKAATALWERLCGQCGAPLGYWIVFIGDEKSVRERAFLEPGMHPDCADYAIGVCPYLAHHGYENRRQLAGVTAFADRARPDRMARYLTRRYEPIISRGVPMAKAAPPKQVTWF